MILTEEQRAAIKLAMKYIARWPFAYKELHARGVLQAMIDSSEHIREPPKMVGFDLERARGLRDFLQDDCAEVEDVWAEMIAEIERLRGEMENYGDDYVCQMKSKDARIQELEDAHKRSGEKYAKIINELRSSVYANMPGLKKQWDEILNTPANDKIGPDAKPRSPQESDDLKHCHSCGKSIEEVKGNLCKGDYFIGSIFLDPGQEASRFDPPIDASYYFSCCDCARSWQITEERKAAIMETIDLLNGDLFRSPYSDVLAVLRGMLTEADHDKP
jgi:hypothetical protein